jgi:hypothetical protein
MMKTHFTEADLLETYYMQPGEAAPVMLHLAGCSDCMDRYARLERKLREAAACPSVKPETFWSRQRLSIMRRIAARPRALGVGSATRVAAAAFLAFVMGGAVVYHEVKPAPTSTPSVEAKTQTVDDMHGPINPWESDELKQYHEVVQWEAWVADSTENSGSGDHSL